MRTWLVVRVLFVFLGIAGCGGSDPSDEDGGVVAPVDAAVDAMFVELALEPPATPAAPALTPCPSGYREVEIEGFTTCDPWPATGRASCTGASAHFPGEPTCRVVGRPCPSGEFADDLPDDAIYVSVDGDGEGDGTREHPFATVYDAANVAEDGDTIALGAGAHENVVLVTPGLTLRGACASRTSLTGSFNVATYPGSVRIEDLSVGSMTLTTEEPVVLRGVAMIGDPESGGMTLLADAIDAEDILVRGAVEGDSGLSVLGAATIRRAVFEHVEQGVMALGALDLADASFFDVQTGIMSSGSDETSVARAVFDEVGAEAIFATGGDLRVEDCVLRGAGGTAVQCYGGETVSVRRSFFRDNVSDIATLSDETVMEDVLILETRETEDGAASVSLIAFDGQVSLSRLAIVRGHGVGVTILGSGETDVTIDDLVVSGTRPLGTGELGRGLETDLVDLTLHRALFEDNTEVALAAFSESNLDLNDVTVRGTRPRASDGRLGRAINLQYGVHAQLTRALIEGSHDVSVLASGRLSDAIEDESGADVMPVELELRDVEIIDTRERGCAMAACRDAPGGVAIGSYHGSHVDLDRFRVRTAALCGIQVESGGEMDVTSGEVLECGIGACLGSDGFDPTRISGVEFRENDQNIDAQRLPVPEAIVPAPPAMPPE